MKILCVNAGSSSLKFQLVEMPEEKTIISGYIEKIGAPDSFWNTKINGEKIRGEKVINNHAEAVQVMLDELLKHKAVESLDEIKGIGHRVLHGGEIYDKSVVINDEVISNVEGLTKLGPLHIPGNLTGIRAMQDALPGVTNVAVFDTAFHQTMPKINYLYPVPMEWYEKYGVRKYGFHGTSHKYITETMQDILGKKDVNLIICHVGSGASVSVVKDGKCIDTTMGLTPLDGLVMGTRSGAIDPSIIEYVCGETGKSVAEVTNDLNKNSGLKGLCGFNDNRDVENAIADGDENAKLALDIYVDRLVRYISQYYVLLDGKVDSIVMTAGVLENGSETREDIMNRLSCLGVTVNKEVNDSIAGFKAVHEGVISGDDSSIEVRVLPTNEEIMIIRDTYNYVK